MAGKPDVVPTYGPPDFLEDFLSGLLPHIARADIPDTPRPPVAEDDATQPDLAAMNGEDDHAYDSGDSDHDHDHGLVGSLQGNGPADVELPGTGSGFAGVVLENGGFSLAKPGSDPDGSPGGGGDKGGKPPKDDDGGDTGGLLSSYTSGGDARTSYNITVNFETGDWTAALQQVFIDAADYLSTIVTGDVSNERVPLFGRVDDLAIDASIIEIDGPDGTLGGAAVFASRVGSELPAAAIMQFDVADIGQALDNGYLLNIVVHEMVHAMGFGGKWENMDLVQTFAEVDEAGVVQDVLRFTGANATAEYNKLAVSENDAYSENGVLIETDFGEGTALVHWDDATFGDLLMTGFIDTGNPGSPELSMMSIAALEDMGYDTIYEPGMDALFV
jgi:hypothetical protein